MKLKTYMKIMEIEQVEMAKNLGLHRNHLALIINHKRMPSIKLAKKISEYTNFKVTIQDLFYPELETELTPDQMFEAIKIYKEKYMGNNLQLNA